MKTYVSNIKGHKYLYAYDSIFIAKGKSIQRRKLLGRVNNLSSVSARKKEFSTFLKEQEIIERTKYWNGKITSTDFLKYVSVERIESLRTALLRSKQEIGVVGSDLMEQNFSVDFIFNSNKMEGSKVPFKQVAEQVKNPSEQVSEEVKNTLRALHYVDSKFFTFNIKSIVELHGILLGHEPAKCGLRSEIVVVNNLPVADWPTIEKEMKMLLMWFAKEKNQMYPPELAFNFYYRFERIHPFIDGNGRTGRLIMNRILKDNHYHPIIIWNKKRMEQMTVFAKRMDGKPAHFYKFMYEQLRKTYEIYLKKLEEASAASRLIEKFFIPSECNYS